MNFDWEILQLIREIKCLERMGIDSESEEANEVPEKMPYIVIVADEMADMMMKDTTLRQRWVDLGYMNNSVY